MTNPFKTEEFMPKKENPFEEKLESVIFPGAFFKKENSPVEEEEKLVNQSEFLGELRDFMQEFAETDLSIDSIDEPREMSKEQANFYVKLYTQLLKEEKEIEDLCEKEIQRTLKSINLFKEKQLKSIKSKKEHFADILREYAANELQGKKTKSLKLPFGTIAFKKQQPTFTYNSEEDIIKVLKEIKPELVKIKTTESIDKTLLKKEGTIVGTKLHLGDKELNVDVEIKEDKFEVKVAK